MWNFTPIIETINGIVTEMPAPGCSPWESVQHRYSLTATLKQAGSWMLQTLWWIQGWNKMTRKGLCHKDNSFIGLSRKLSWRRQMNWRRKMSFVSMWICMSGCNACRWVGRKVPPVSQKQELMWWLQPLCSACLEPTCSSETLPQHWTRGLCRWKICFQQRPGQS